MAKLKEKNPVALVTGCSTGIGFETAILLACNGYRVFAGIRDLKRAGPLREAARQVGSFMEPAHPNRHGLQLEASAQGFPLEIILLDVDKTSSVQKAVAQIIRKAGRLDVLVNNAGWGAFGAMEEFSDEEIRTQYETNFFGLLRVTQTVLPLMRKQGFGRILNVGSLAGKMTFSGIGLYCSTKYAVEAFTESLRLEVRPFNIQVAVVEPGNIKTPFKTNRRKAAVFVKGKSAYQGILENILRFGNKTTSSTPGPAKVARTLFSALQAEKMALRYPVGRDAVGFPFIRWFLPDALFDWVLKFRYDQFRKGSGPGKLTQLRGTRAGSKKVALVTGANSGFGLALARALAEKGMRVYATYRNPRKAGPLWGLSRSLPVFPVVMDVNSSSSVERGVSKVLQREGKIDILLNNAGFVMAGCWEDLSEQDVRDQFETNVFGLLRVTRAVLPILRRQGSGKILNIGSVSGFAATPCLGAYAATKFAVNSITEALRMEARPFGVDVAEVNPGEIQTSIVANARRGEKVLSPRSPYTPLTQKFQKFSKERFERAAPVENLVEVVLKALGQSPMKRRYLVKLDDYATYFLRWLLPDSIWEWGLRRMFDQPKA